MSVRCITAVLDRSQHAGTNLLMMVVLADYSDDDGNSYPAVASLARKCRMGRRNAIYVLTALQESGELRVLKNEGPKGCNRYRIVLDALGVSKHSKPVQRVAPVQATAPVQPASRGGATGFRKPVQPVAPEPSLNRQRTVSAFADRFWPAYPRKVNRKAAEKAFIKVNPNSQLLDAMLIALSAQIKAEGWTGDQYTPHAATWLNGERWKDEIASPAGKSSGSAWEGAR